ncbi:hypothetical protein [Actinoplanes sp. NPDC026670]|uniref:hypothetical protein n=1 Tax=Actinoplanes sp. NPDC026670 TaxID=3154700 RepID=UPI0033DAEA55
MIGYWDPLPTARRLVDEGPLAGLDPFQGRWEDLNWRNVPGPFYAGETDSMALGRLDAPRHICYDDDRGNGTASEFVYRQPVDEAETESLISGCRLELWQGYQWDGDEHWTVAGVREWWRDRARVREWAVAIATDWEADGHPQWGFAGGPEYVRHYREAARGHRDFIAYLDDGLEGYLRGYLFWLDQRRAPRPGEALPRLGR